MEYVRDVPYALAVCHLDGRQAAVEGLSDGGLILRTAVLGPFQALKVRFLEPKTGRFVSILPQNWHVFAQRETLFGWETELRIDDPAYARLARKALADWASFVRCSLAGEYDFSDGCTSPSFSRQKALWFKDFSIPDPDGDWELALSLDRPFWYRAFLSTADSETYQSQFLKYNHLDHCGIFHRPFTRLYVGNAYCVRLFPDPDTLEKILAKASAAGLAVTLTLPTLRGPMPPWMEAAARAVEVAVNDWGALRRLRGSRILLGTMLNRRRKDPRMEEVPGFAEHRGDLVRNGLDDPVFSAWLREMGVERYEYESCGLPPSPTAGRRSLHVPFYQTNTSHDCVLAAACQGRDPGVAGGPCREECAEWALLYPDDMGLVGRYNSIFALDRDILRDTEALRVWLASGVDRLVVEAL